MDAGIPWTEMGRDVLVPLDQADLIAWPYLSGRGLRGRGEEQKHQQTHKPTHGDPPSIDHGFRHVVWHHTPRVRDVRSGTAHDPAARS